MLKTHASHAKPSTRTAFALVLFAAAAVFTGTIAATPAWAGDDFSAREHFTRHWTGQLSERQAGATYLAQAGGSGTEIGAEADDFSARQQFTRHWTGQLSDRQAGATYLAQAGGSGTEIGAEAVARNGRSGPDYWGASLARDPR
jgi:hypothetical protein